MASKTRPAPLRPYLVRRGTALWLTLLLGSPAFGQQPTPTSSPTFTLRVQSDIVLTNVVVRDKKTGAVVRGLKASDFTVLENGKPQTVSTFDFQSVDEAATMRAANGPASEGTVTGTVADLLNRNLAADPAVLRDRRLIVLFFDLSSMQPEDIDRAVEAAENFIRSKMQPADLLAAVSMGTSLSMDQDFTADKAALLRAVARYNGTDTTGFTGGGQTGSTDGTADNAGTFAADDTEYNSLNTDRELLAIRTIARSLERVDQRKSLLYFSGGLSRNGVENQASLRAATNEAVRANMAIYSVDSRGLEALPPVGNASQGSLRGISAYNGGSVQSGLDANFGSQEVLGTLASDTGGKFFSDSNDFAPAFQQIQRDTEAYYILGFRSTNTAHDGSYRRLTVRLNRNDARLEYRPGYYAAADFQHQKTADREQVLQDQLRSDLPATDLPVYLQALYFRVAESRFLVPVSLIIPGSQLPSPKEGDRGRPTLDVAGEVKNNQGIVVGNVRDTVKLAAPASQSPARRNLQYATGFTLAPGRYHLKFVVRENETGKMGSFETDLSVPDLRKATVKLSSVLLSTQQTAAAAKKAPDSPLVHDGMEWIPNVPRVFRQDQRLSLLYEVYDPARQKLEASAAATPAGLNRRPEGAVRVLTSIEFLSGGTKVYETPLVEATAVNVPGRNAVRFAFEVPLASLEPGTYVCQINVIDDGAGAFSFPRLALLVTAARPAAPAASSAPATAPAPPTP